MKKGLLSGIAISLTLSSLLMACSNEEASKDTKKSDGTGTLDVSLALMGGPKTPNAWTETALEEDLTDHLGREVNIENIFLPGWEEAKTKINLLMSDTSQMPDVMWHWDMNKEFQSWAKAGAVQDLTPYLQENGKNIINYYSKETMFYHWDPSGKIFRIPGDVSEPGTMTTIIRKDWLEKLGLEVPTTVDEYIEVLKAFTHDDPDGNGKDDTYGISGENLYRAFAPFFLAYGVDPDQFMITEDGTVKYGSTLPEVREVLQILQDLYKEGVIDPRMLSPIEQAKVDEIMANGKIGSIYRWVAFFNPDFNHHMSFKAINPDGEYMPIEPIKGPDGFASDLPADEIGWSFLSVTAAAEEPGEVVKVIDRIASPETYKLVTYGKEGEHYEMKDGQYKSLVNPDEMNKLGLGNYNWYVQRKDEANIQNTPEVIELFNKRAETSMPIREKTVFFKAISRPAWTEYGTDINTLRDETFWGIISGNLEISAFDEFVKKYPELGGNEVDEEANTLYKEQEKEFEEFSKWYDENIEPYK
ncbi:extracellular solute-binding protein [Metabacillus halosaccharovorans]|uniref:extracellular solute-binding protein n=1 Tax=Metabacillus halosaccharovorans TaxID=930124 RepID=UPI002040B650|nr:extracellular solute-binding protein [Metabacillus halosaccharovorans]MCM3440274.1 extracellular solute-binding protein [Metabacillus halosaccharovorans]